MPDVSALEPVRLREVWPNEARDFTPWLAGNITLLGEHLSLSLERPETEVTLPVAGRVDIQARNGRTGGSVVIENQLEESDDSHCLRLLGYAADTEANVLVWVAAGFSQYHRQILRWLNDADTIDVYAVRVRAYRVGDRLAVDFRTVVAPARSAERRPVTLTTLYGEFYRPLVARLRRRGVQPISRGGGRGRYRSFETGHSGATYWTGFDDYRPRVGLYLHGPGHQERYDEIASKRAVIQEHVGERSVSLRPEEHGIVVVRSELLRVAASSEEEMEVGRQWMAESLLSLRSAVEPFQELLRAGEAAFDAAKGAD